MTVVNSQPPSPAGATPTYNTASAGGDKIQQPEGDIIIVRNGGGSSINMTLVTPGTLPNGDQYPDKVIAVPAGGERWVLLGPEYTDSNQQCSITWSATTSVTFAVLGR